MKRRARRGRKEEGSGAVAWFDRSKEFILDSADASVTVQSDGLYLIPKSVMCAKGRRASEVCCSERSLDKVAL